MNTKIYAEIIVCPECREDIEEIVINQQLIGFHCTKCRLVFPVKDNIPIILPNHARSYRLEYELVDALKNQFLPVESDFLAGLDNTLRLLDSQRDFKSWEWEDEEFWSNEYKNEATSSIEKKWNDRIWEREFLMEHFQNNNKFYDKTILDVGSGEGQNFRLLISKYCDDNVLYIAADISFAGLKLNRMRNKHANSMYVLCTADHLPFRKNSIDILTYFGILHHTEKKAKSIPNGVNLLKEGGYLLIHEAIATKPLLPQFIRNFIQKSAHEERINLHELLTEIETKNNLAIIKQKSFYTHFFTGIFWLLRSIMMRSKTLFNFLLHFDERLNGLLGNYFNIFQAGEFMALIRKN